MTKQTTKVEASPVVDAKEVQEPTMEQLQQQIQTLTKQLIEANEVNGTLRNTIVKLAIKL